MLKIEIKVINCTLIDRHMYTTFDVVITHIHMSSSDRIWSFLAILCVAETKNKCYIQCISLFMLDKV